MYKLSPETAAKVKHYHPEQPLFFVMSDRSRAALVVAAEIGIESARSEARRIGGCVRVGRVVDGEARTM